MIYAAYTRPRIVLARIYTGGGGILPDFATRVAATSGSVRMSRFNGSRAAKSGWWACSFEVSGTIGPALLVPILIFETLVVLVLFLHWLALWL